MEKLRKTFLSYSRANKEFAVKLAQELKSEGFPVWLDQLDIPLGARWDVEVENALIECEIFMIIITKDSIASENVLDEIGYAIDNGKRFLPILLEKSNIPLRLRRFQYVDFTNKSFDEGVKAAKELLRSLNALPTVPRMSVPEKTEVTQDQTDGSALQKSRATGEKHLAIESVSAPQEAQKETRPVSTRSRSKLIGVFGISIFAILVVGYMATRLISGSSFSNGSAVANEPNALIPVTSDDSPTPVMESPTPTSPPTEVSTPTASELLAEITDDKGAEMVLVPEGDFVMGSDRGEQDEQPAHTVFLDAYYIDKFEVTNKLYKACVDDGKCDPPRQIYFFAESPSRIYYDNPQYDNFPVIYVDWNMAKAYCEWRGARLPTEAEWEKAARGKEGNTYPWGKDLDCQRANYQNCVNRTSEVGRYPGGASPYGVHDMAGNVWEWVADWYSANYYSNSPRNNPQGPVTGQSRVIRGGSWPRFDVTAYHHNNFAPDYNTFDIGFRCAMDAE